MDRGYRIKREILTRLCSSERELGADHRLRIDDIAAAIGEDFDIVYRHALSLRDFGLVRGFDSANHVMITPEGIAKIDTDNPFVSHLRASVSGINITGPVTDSAIIQGDGNVVSAADFLNRFGKAVENSDLPAGEKKSWGERIKQLASHPVLLEILKKMLGEM